MSTRRPVRHALGAALGAGVAVAAASCTLDEGVPTGVAGTPSAGTANTGKGGASGMGGSTTGGQGATAGGSTGGSATAGAGGNAGSIASTGGSSTGGSGVGGSSGGTSASGTGPGGMAGTSGSGTGGSSSNCTDTPPPNGSCQDAVSFGWCGQDWMNGACAQSCGLCAGGSGGSGGSAGTGTGGKGGSGTAGTSGNVSPPPDINGGSNGWASRYWDCCKPACGWTANVPSGQAMEACNQQNQSLGGDFNARNACESGGTAYMCWDGAPWQVGDRLSYGFAAASGGNYRCGRCYHLQFTGTGHDGNNPGVGGLAGKHMIVQVINNGGVGADQFDILIPGGGVGDFNACSAQWGVMASELGAQYGGFMRGCNNDTNCVRQKCEQIFGDKPELKAGCDWFLGWYNAADNPNVKFQQIACPAEITQRSGLPDAGG